jgi:hypothetical protein
MSDLNSSTGSAVTGGSALGNNPGGLGASSAGGASNAQHNDYGDKAFDAVAKKSGHNVDAGTSEKITDGARGLFEKATG